MSSYGFMAFDQHDQHAMNMCERSGSRSEDVQPDWCDYFLQAEQTSLLICADPGISRPSAAHVSRLAAGVGHRILDIVPIDASVERLSALVNVDAIVVMCSGCESGLVALLARLDLMASAQGTKLIVIVQMSALDQVHALLQSDNSAILCEPGPEDVVAALSALNWPSRDREQFFDIGRENEGSQIERLSDQLVRLSRTIEALVQNRQPDGFPFNRLDSVESSLRSPDRGYAARDATDGSSGPSVAGYQVRAILRARRLREHLVASDLFADPAWDIMLDLMAARLEQSRVSVSSLCIAAAVPPTTALRWIRQLTERGLLERQADPKDGRRIFIALSDLGAEAVLRWFRESRAHLQTALGLGSEARNILKLSS